MPENGFSNSAKRLPNCENISSLRETFSRNEKPFFECRRAASQIRQSVFRCAETFPALGKRSPPQKKSCHVCDFSLLSPMPQPLWLRWPTSQSQPNLGPTKSKKLMATDYMPKSLDNLEPWLAGLKNGITTDGPTCNQSPAQIAEDTAFIDSILGPVSDANAKELQAIEASGTAQTALSHNRDGLRRLINRYKNANGFTEGMGAAWKITTHQSQSSNDKPALTATAVSGRVVIRGRKPGFTSVTIQMRPDGTNDWADIGMKISRFPFYDTTAPQTPGKPEKREYRALGYIGDDQVGPPSDIVTAIFAD
jgi:hypothetical protein